MADMLHVTGKLEPAWQGRQRVASNHGAFATVRRGE